MANLKEIVNRKAKFEYHFLKEYEAGIMLCGTEVKSLRAGNGNINDAFCMFIKGELFIKQMHIAEYEYGNQNNHETTRERKLLLKKSELTKLERRVKEKGLTIVPYKIYFSDRGLIKIKLCLAQGKKSFDKSNSIKEKDAKREMERAKKFDLR